MGNVEIVTLKTGEKVLLKIKAKQNSFLEEEDGSGEFVRKSYSRLVEIIEEKTILGRKVIVEEYVKGNTLDEIIRGKATPLLGVARGSEIVWKTSEFLEEEIIEIGIQLCEGIRFLHWQKTPIIHGDIKPENIMLLRRNPIEIKLLDVDDGVELREERLLKQYRGTIGFCPPEVTKGREVCFQTDIYGIGKTLEFLLYGSRQKFFEMKEGSRGIKSHKKRLLRIIKKATAPNPNHRFVTVAEFKKELAAILSEY
ncbi:MAG: protein kinase [Lachnospiraceae bacterium]|nr:protein kinase [Lachnospiraceae bacterium]